MAAITACDGGAPQAGASASASAEVAPSAPLRGKRLASMTWLEAEKALGAETVVVIALGAGAKEHGPHLPLENDWLIAQYFEERVLERADVVVAPGIPYHYYPAFAEYPGSTTLRLETARDLVVDVVVSLAAHGPRRFYVLNTGFSTLKALAPAAEELRARGILLAYTDPKRTHAGLESITQQQGGSHADEIETSMMLVIAPTRCDMSRAVKDYDESQLPGLSRQPDAGKTYSPSGVWGDATLATRAKGERIVAGYLRVLLEDIEALRSAPLP
jgi:creatinine amidohydrolase